MPKFSIVTVVWNHHDGLRRTGESIISQENDDFEWIVIDGGSDEPTQEVLQRFKPQIDKLVSEPDRGVYDAMNKGLAMATGEWVIFMNAGDVFAHHRVLWGFHADERDDMAYGEVYWAAPSGEKVRYRTRPVKHIWKGNCFCHQALFTRRELAQRLGFNERLRIVADYEFVVRATQSGAKVRPLNYIVAIIEPGGLSDDFYLRTKERFWVALKHFSAWDVVPHFIKLVRDQRRRERLART